MAFAWVMLVTCVIPVPKIVITTNAVIRITMAATTTVSVMFILPLNLYVQAPF